MTYLIDSHCHFDFEVFDKDRELIWQYCLKNKVNALFIPSVKASAFERTLDVCRQNSAWYPMLGLHPYFIAEHSEQAVAILEHYLVKHRREIIAVGEIGLDFYEGRDNEAKQIDVFKAQLKLAKRFQLPAVIHSRKANDEILKVINEVRFEQGGIIHAFSGSLQQAERLIDKGFLLGFGGAVTYERATRLRELLRQLPLESISFETDSPDMPPSFLGKGERNTPANLTAIVEQMALLREQDMSSLIEVHFEQIQKLFSLELPSS